MRTFALLLTLSAVAQAGDDPLQVEVASELQPVKLVEEFNGKPTLEWTIRNWQTSADRQPAARSTVAWTGSNVFTRSRNGTVRLYLGAWDNPRPKERVENIDFISTNTKAGPFCVAMTVEQ